MASRRLAYGGPGWLAHPGWPFFEPAWRWKPGAGPGRRSGIGSATRTPTAQSVVDGCVQMLGGPGVTRGHPAERLYREVRALRIDEGATELQKLVIARQLLAAASRTGAGEAVG